jgi:hypothetical protein
MNYIDIIKGLIMANARATQIDGVTVFKLPFKSKNVIVAVADDEFSSHEETMEYVIEILLAKICPAGSQPVVEKSEDAVEEVPCENDEELYNNFKEKQAEKKEKFLSYPLVDVKEFTTRLHAFLWKNEIYYVRDLVERSEADFRAIRGFGVGMVKQIKSFVMKHGLKLKKS